MEPNFSGYVTKANLQCADGRTIKPGTFAHQSGTKVPVVYQHVHDDIAQVLGHALLTEKEDGTWGDVFLNPDVPAAVTADALVKHGDIKKFSIWAKNLIEHGLDVVKGDIQEVSLCLSGKNAGANIENYNGVLAHGGLDEDDVLLIVGGEIAHSDTPPEGDTTPPAETPPAEETTPPAEETTPPAEGDQTVKDVLDTLSDDQRTAVNSVIDDIVTEAVTEALTEEPEVQHGNTDSSKKGTQMARNAFDREKNNESNLPELKHSDVAAVLNAAKAGSGVDSLRSLVRSDTGKELLHADTYGIDNIEVLFPEAQALMRTPTFVDRRQDWVKKFMAGVSKSPFSRVKTIHADITADEARARGYIKGNQKVEEVFPVFKRTTGPAMIYKKQKLDRQDIIDIVDFDVVAWMKVEMRGKLDEELARAALFGDGRPAMVGGDINPDKIAEPDPNATSGDGIRSIVNDNDLYTGTYSVPMSATPTQDEYIAAIDTVTEAREDYMGSGNITAFMSYKTASKFLTIRDSFKHRIYRNLSEVAGDLDVNEIVRVPTELMGDNLLVLIDLQDYNFGANRGGEVTLFEDFDIDFNQHKYLIETYLSGAQTLPYCSQVFKRVDATDTEVEPVMLSFTNPGTVEYVAQTGVVYKRTDTGATLAADITLADGESVTVEAFPAAGYYFPDNLDRTDSRTYEYGDPTD